MRRTLATLPHAALSLSIVVWLTPLALAQDTKTAGGTVTAMAADSISVKSADQTRTFAVDTNTDVIVRGGSTASRAAARAGRPGPTLTELLKIGDAVEVKYQEKNGVMRAALIRGSEPPAARRPASSDYAGSANGRVEALSGTVLTIAGPSGGGGTFTQTFTIDRSTKVIATGAGTAAAARGGAIPVTDVIARGDRVSVSYHPVGSALHASEIRVVEKAMK